LAEATTTGRTLFCTIPIGYPHRHVAQEPGAGFFVMLLAAQSAGISQSPAAFDAAFLNGFTWRNLGPFRTGAWISDIASGFPRGSRSIKRRNQS
jgi:hypothetical protein